MTERKYRSTINKIAIFRACFTGLKDVYGTYNPQTGRACQMKEPVTDEVIFAHLAGRQPYGVYLLVKDRTGALAVDFDMDDISRPVAFVDAAYEYGLAVYIERSKSKGYHVWIFFADGGASARKARLVAKKFLTDIHSDGIEIFPKQDALDNQNNYGNFINAPLFGPLVAKGRTVFLDTAASATPYPDQWEFLENTQRVPEQKLDEIIAACDLNSPNEPGVAATANTPPHANPAEASRFGLPVCAQRMLTEGVTSNQRVACFRLAVNLKRTGLPYDLAVATLDAWAVKNKPIDGKRIITGPEIESQAQDAYNKSYRGLGCEEAPVCDFCDPDCPLYQLRISSGKPAGVCG